MEVSTRKSITVLIELSQEEAENALLDPKQLLDAIQDQLPVPKEIEKPREKRGVKAKVGLWECPKCHKQFKRAGQHALTCTAEEVE